MYDLIVGLGLVLVIEGLLWALFPGMAIRLLAMASQMSEQSLRLSGLTAIGLGFLIVWAIRG